MVIALFSMKLNFVAMTTKCSKNNTKGNMEMILKTVVTAILAAASFQASAALITMTDGNSTFSVDDVSGSANSWTVEGLDQLFNQSYYYRIGSTGGENNLSSLTLSGSTLSANRFLELQYTGAGFIADFTYVLDGGANGSGVADLAQNVTITNTTSSALDLHFFQYNDFDLYGSASGQTVTQINANTVHQTNGTSALTEQVGTPAPDHFQVDGYPVIQSLLTDSSPTILNGNATYTGDATWGWQWDFNIAGYDSVQISKDVRLEIDSTPIPPVPVPAAVWLFGSGLLGLVGIARRKKA
jgi:hypothetical protein